MLASLLRRVRSSSACSFLSPFILSSFSFSSSSFLRPSTETHFRRVSSLLVHAENNSGKRKSRDNDRDLEQHRGRSAARNYFVKELCEREPKPIFLSFSRSHTFLVLRKKKTQAAEKFVKLITKTIQKEELIFLFSRLFSSPPLSSRFERSFRFER